MFRPSATSTTLRLSSLVFALGSALIGGCSPGGPGTDAGPDDGGPNLVEDNVCPQGNGGAYSVCQLQNPNSPNRPTPGAAVSVKGVVALSDVYDITDTLQGVFVADVPLATYGGILVTFAKSEGFSASTGALLDVEGTFDSFSSGSVGSEERLKATSLVAAGGTSPVAAIDVADPAVLADETTGEAYEGLLVTVRDVTVEDASLGFGQWQVTGGLVTDDSLYGYSPIVGEVFSSLTGVMGYNAFAGGGFRLMPRSAADLVSASRPSATIGALRDPQNANYSAPCQSGSFDCAPVLLSQVVVTSEPYFISSGSSGPLFGFFVADPKAVDGDGRLLPYSGILVTITPGRDDVTSSYSFEQDDDYNFVSADAAPAVGDVVKVIGRNGDYFGMSQLYFSSLLEKVGTTDTLADVTMPLPARFDGSLSVSDARHPSRLKGGRPAVTVEQGGTTRDAETPDAAVEGFEGVLVELVNIETTSACEAYPYKSDDVAAYMRDFGYFRVTGDVEVGDLFQTDPTFGGFWKSVPATSTERTCANTANKCEDSRAVGQAFTSLTGIVNISYDVYRLNPRSADDIPAELFAADGSGSCGAN